MCFLRFEIVTSWLKMLFDTVHPHKIVLIAATIVFGYHAKACRTAIHVV